jgi:hypothetical protein
VLLDTDAEIMDVEPEALIQEARERQLQRARRRNVVLGTAALLVILGFGVNRLAREGGGVQAAPPSSSLLQDIR